MRNTLAVAHTVPLRVPEPSPRGLFIAAYHVIAAACRPYDRPGLGVFVIADDTGAVVGQHAVLASDRPAAILIGSHEMCDLVIPGAALRQLVVVVEPFDGERVGYRVIDLRPDGDLTDESGRGVHALRTDGPAILRTGAWTVFVLPLGDPAAWPRAELAWATLPPRIYVDDCGNTPPPRHLLTSVAFRVAPPRTALEDLVCDDGLGTLELTQAHGSSVVGVGMRALADGVVVGRSSGRDIVKISDPTLSRLHVLVIRLGGRIFAIDLASTFGTRPHGARSERVCELAADTELWLGHSTRVRWRTGTRDRQ